ncbi:MAG TPA: glycosyltransferase [Puia sp.]|jgi:sterol 3beta-glucosyltransferase|nr:glycosyltransferase [Puia sp.]
MHYGIVTYGSRGDVQPYVALALGLQERGHEVTLLANENFKDFVEGHGINFFPLAGNMEDMVRSPKISKLLRSGNMVSYLREMKKLMRTIQPQVNANMLRGAREADVLIASPLTLVWVHSIAEKLHKNWAIIQLSVPAIPTKEFPFAGFDLFNFPLYNLFTYKLVRYVYWQLNKKDINEHRTSLRLPPFEKSVLKKIADQKILNLHAFSPSLIARPKDWPEEIQITGFLTIPGSKRKDQIKDELPIVGLETWLKNGEPPIYIGFGSIPIPNPELLSKILKEIINTTDHRFIFCTGWSDLLNLPRHENLFIIKHANHEWLFPQCKAAIIHGGIGTIAATLKAKISPIIISIFADQPLWGKLIDKRKLGVHIPFRKLTTRKLLDAIEKAETPQLKKNARNTGEMINGQDGIRSAINALENYFEN